MIVILLVTLDLNNFDTDLLKVFATVTVVVNNKLLSTAYGYDPTVSVLNTTTAVGLENKSDSQWPESATAHVTLPASSSSDR